MSNASKAENMTARELYSEVEMDILTAISMATFLARALDCFPDLDKVEAQGAQHVVTAIRERMQAVKDAFIEARGDS